MRQNLSKVDELVAGKTKRVLIEVRDVAVVYNRSRSLTRRDLFPALKRINLDLHAGESLGVVGRNGVGKTTLLRLLAEIIKPDRGTIRNFGASTAMLTMQLGFDQSATGRTNIILSALLLGYTERQIHARMDEIIAYAELGEFIDQPLTQYSTGMRARLGFSICYYMQPDVLLIDEALGVGDIEFRKKSTLAMKEKIKSDQTVVLVSHDGRTIKSLCNRAVWIEDGVSRMEGDAAEVVEAYEDFVKSNPRTIATISA